MTAPRTLYDKIWDDHVVETVRADGTALLYIDRHLVHEVTSPQAFEGLRMAGRKVHAAGAHAGGGRSQHSDDRSLASASTIPESRTQIETLAARTSKNSASSTSTSMTSARASSISSAPSRASRCPARRSSAATRTPRPTAPSARWRRASARAEVEHVLATQTLIQKKAKNMRVAGRGRPPPPASPRRTSSSPSSARSALPAAPAM